MKRAATIIGLTMLLLPLAGIAAAEDCGEWVCEGPDVGVSPGALSAAYAGQTPAGNWFASNQPPVAHPYTYALTRPCVADDRDTGTCRPSDFLTCPAPPG